MKFLLTVKHKNPSSYAKGKEWIEPYDLPEITTLEQARRWGEKTIAYFNRTLRPGEEARIFLGVSVSEEAQTKVSAHVWEKQNLYTQTRGHRLFDVLKCKHCGITAKRYGLNNIKRDAQYRSSGYESCSRAIENMRRKATRQGKGETS